MAPGQRDKPANDDRNYVDDETETPRYRDVGTRPEEPSLDIIFDVSAVVVGMRLVPEEVDKQCRGDDEAREERRADEGGE